MTRIIAELVVNGQRIFIRELEEAGGGIDDLGDSADESSGRLSGMTSAMTALGGALATAGLAKAGKEAAEYAIELQAMSDKADVVFGDHNAMIRDFSEEHASRFGLAKDELTGLAAGYGDLLVPMGFTRQRAAELTEQTLRLAGALGEWTPELGGAEHALDALGAAMTGETDGLKAYGIVIDAATIQAEMMARGLDDLTGEAERQATAMVTLDLATRGSADAQANFAAGGNAAVVAQRELEAASREARAELGENLVPVLTTMNGLLADAAGFVGDLPEPAQTAGIALVGIGAASIPIASVASNLSNLGLTGARLATFMTGPWGLAIGAVTVGLGMLWNEQQQANQRIADATELIDANTGALTANAEIGRAAQLQESGLAEQAERYGVSLATLTAASMGNTEAQAEMSRVMEEYREIRNAQIREEESSAIGASSRQRQLRDDQDDLTSAILGQADALDTQQAAALASLEAGEEANAMMRDGVSILNPWASGLADVSTAMDAQAAIAWNTVPAHQASMGAAIAHAEQQERLAEAHRMANQRMDEQRDRLRAAVDPMFAASQAQERWVDAQEKLEAAETTEARAAAQDEVARAAVDLQGALVDLDAAQRDGTTSAETFGDALDALRDQGLIDDEILRRLTEDFDELADSADRARDAIYGVTRPNTSSRGGVTEGLGANAAGSDAVGSTFNAVATLAPSSPIGLQVGQVNLNGVDPDRPGEARRLSDEFLAEIVDGIAGISYDRGGRP